MAPALKVSVRSAILLILVGALINESTHQFSSPLPGQPSDSDGTRASDSDPFQADASPQATKVVSKKKYKPITPEKSLPKEYRLCRLQPSPQINQTPVRMKGPGIPIWYQCAGKPYDEFMYKVFGLVKQKLKAKPKSKWGKRKYIVPKILAPNPPKRHRKILVIGNSHTRQVIAALVCQYRDDITSSRVLVPSTARKNLAVEYTFESHDNLTVYVIVNHPFVYSKTWKATLEIDMLKHPLHDLDAIVLGAFNSYRESRGTSFLNTTLAYQKQFPHQGVDFEHIEAPTIEEFAKVYPGPIVWLSMFAHYNVPIHQHALELIQTLSVTHRRDNLRSVNGRNYIDELGGEECSSNVGEVVATCVTDKSNHVYKNGHRCAGDKGGQPDLIAWDVVDALHNVLKDDMKT